MGALAPKKRDHRKKEFEFSWLMPRPTPEQLAFARAALENDDDFKDFLAIRRSRSSFRRRNAAITRVIERHSGLIKFVIKEMRRTGQYYVMMNDGSRSQEDLEQDMRIGLFTAAQKFNMCLGYKFSTYAMWWIKHGGRETLKGVGIIYWPGWVHDCIYKLKQLQAEFRERGERLTPSVIKERLEIKHSTYKILRFVCAWHLSRKVSTEALVEHLESDSVFGADYLAVQPSLAAPGQVIGDASVGYDTFEMVRRKRITQEVREVFRRAKFTPREKFIITRYYGLDGAKPLTLEVIGKKMDLTRERIRQIKQDGLSKLGIRHEDLK